MTMDAHWTDGYVTDIDYTHGYYPQLNPARLQLAMAAVGLDSPVVRSACELGFGQGLSINLHAAASAVAWHACRRPALPNSVTTRNCRNTTSLLCMVSGAGFRQPIER